MPPTDLAARRKPRILRCRQSSLGNVVHALPALCALRRRRPGAYLVWIVEDWLEPLLSRHDALDALLAVSRGALSPWPRRGLPWRLAALPRIRRRLRVHRVRWSVDLHGRTKSALAAWLSGAGIDPDPGAAGRIRDAVLAPCLAGS